jgi:hypothetical protein
MVSDFLNYREPNTFMPPMSALVGINNPRPRLVTIYSIDTLKKLPYTDIYKCSELELYYLN